MISTSFTARILLLTMVLGCSTSFLTLPQNLQQRTTTTTDLQTFLARSSSIYRSRCTAPLRPSSMILLAKKKKASAPKGQGFGKTTSPSIDDNDDSDDDDSDDVSAISTATTKSSESSPFSLESVAMSSKQSQSNVVDNTPADVRTQRILREKYGLKPISEQKVDPNSPFQPAAKTPNAPEEEFDIFTKLPEPVLLAVDRFLKLGLTVSAILFIAAGLGVTWEAWSVTSNTPLPEDIDRFITNVVEPNFTTGLFVLLGFSISLGLFASAQLGSQSSQYREDE